jgi:hypothetical protein
MEAAALRGLIENRKASLVVCHRIPQRLVGDHRQGSTLSEVLSAAQNIILAICCLSKMFGWHFLIQRHITFRPLYGSELSDRPLGKWVRVETSGTGDTHIMQSPSEAVTQNVEHNQLKWHLLDQSQSVVLLYQIFHIHGFALKYLRPVPN